MAELRKQAKAALSIWGTLSGVSAADAYPDLLQFLGGYLHQDFDLDAESAEAAVQHAITETAVDRRAVVAREIEALLASHRDEPSLAAAVGQLCAYHPPGNGLTYREWLGELRARLVGAE